MTRSIMRLETIRQFANLHLHFESSLWIGGLFAGHIKLDDSSRTQGVKPGDSDDAGRKALGVSTRFILNGTSYRSFFIGGRFL